MLESIQRSRWWTRGPVLPIAVVLLGLFLNLYRINAQSLWANEAFSVAASAQSLSAMRDALIEDFVHPPLHYLALHAWMDVLGVGSLQARLLSAIFGTLAVAMLYLLGTYLFGRATGLLAAALLAISQINIRYSQEARPYEMVLLLLLCTVYLLVRALRERSVPLWWGFVLSSFALLFTNYYAVSAAGIMYAYAFLCRKKYDLPLSRIAAGIVVVAALYAPWLTSGVVLQALQSSKTLPEKLGPWFRVHWWTPATTINDISNGSYFGIDHPAAWWNYVAAALLFGIPVMVALWPLARRASRNEMEPERREDLLLLASLFVIPLGIALSLGAALHVQYHLRYVVYIQAPYFLLVARGLLTLPRETWRKGMVALVLLYSAGALPALYNIPFKEDYRDALGDVARNYRPGDCTVFYPKGIPKQWTVYVGDPSRLRVVTVSEALHNGGACQRIWAVASWQSDAVARIARRDLAALEPLYAPQELDRYFWVDVALYEQKGLATTSARAGSSGVVP